MPEAYKTPSNQVHPEGCTTPSDVAPKSDPSANNVNLSWRIVFFVAIVNIAFSGAVCAILILRMNSSLEHAASASSESIGQLSINQQILNATVAHSIANQQTLNAAVAQSIGQLSTKQQILNSTLNVLLVDGNTVCSNSFDYVSCGCKSGFSGRSFNCIDVDECRLQSCHANASCFNTIGSFNCSCNTGFSGSGYACSDIDECALNKHNCIIGDSCRNTLGSFDCMWNASSISVSILGAHTCAVTTSGAAKCWGSGSFGQLGNGATRDSHTPVDVSGMSSGVLAIAAGRYHTCAVTTSGAAKCWGHGNSGKLGKGKT